MKNLQTLLQHSAAIQAILFAKSTKLTVELKHTPTPIERHSVKIQFHESLCSITQEPLMNYCKKNKVDLKIRGAYNDIEDPVTEIEISC